MKQIKPGRLAALFALTDGNWFGWKFSLHSVKAKSITAKIQTIILEPRREYYSSGWLVLSPIFLSTHHHRDVERRTPSIAFLPMKADFPSDVR